MLKLYQLLRAEDKIHYQSDLARQLNCSPQNIIRLTHEIEQNNPDSFQTGTNKNRRWYRLKIDKRSMLKPSISPYQHEMIATLEKMRLQLSMLLFELSDEQETTKSGKIKKN